ncbi:hypothetical protein CPB86DRAFT_179636 [Serendipita vermifera]|nr:hypothetical protein CPB86DRAFT_179636 [Serendipita vermifera]
MASTLLLVAYPPPPQQVLAMSSAGSSLPAMSNYSTVPMNVAYSTGELVYGPAPVAPDPFDISLFNCMQAGSTFYSQSLPNSSTHINSPGSNATNSSASSPYSTPQMEQDALDPKLMEGFDHKGRALLGSCQPLARDNVIKALQTREYLENQMLRPNIVATLCLIKETKAAPGRGGPGSRKPIQHFICKICLKKKTTNRRTIEDHVHSHFGLKPLPCHVPDCDKAFLRHHERFRHEQDVHKLEPTRGSKGGKRTPLGRLASTPLNNAAEIEAHLQQLGITFEENKSSKKSTKRPTSAPAGSPFNLFKVSPQKASASNTTFEKAWIARAVRLKGAIWHLFGLCAG